MLESKRRATIFLVLSFIFALLAGFLFLQQVQNINADLGGTTEVIVADTNIDSRALLHPDHLSTMDLPNRFITNSHVTDPGELEGMVSVVPLAEGDLLTANVLRPYSNVTDENNRLVMLRNEHVIFDQQLESQDRVDIIVSHSFDGEDITEVFMEDVPVMMVSQDGNEFYGIAVEVSADEAPDLIHMQNYAQSLRVLKANVGSEEATEEQLNEEFPVEEQWGEEDEENEEITDEEREELDEQNMDIEENESNDNNNGNEDDDNNDENHNNEDDEEND